MPPSILEPLGEFLRPFTKCHRPPPTAPMPNAPPTSSIILSGHGSRPWSTLGPPSAILSLLHWYCSAPNASKFLRVRVSYFACLEFVQRTAGQQLSRHRVQFKPLGFERTTERSAISQECRNIADNTRSASGYFNTHMLVACTLIQCPTPNERTSSPYSVAGN